jgi:hypothetical protein
MSVRDPNEIARELVMSMTAGTHLPLPATIAKRTQRIAKALREYGEAVRAEERDACAEVARLCAQERTAQSARLDGEAMRVVHAKESEADRILEKIRARAEKGGEP